MKKFFVVMLSIAVMLGVSLCIRQNETMSPIIAPTPAISVQAAKPPISENEIIPTKEAMAEYDEIYIGNKNSKKLHRPDCYTLPAEKNRVEFTSREEAISSGYSPCKHCQP